MFEQLISAFVLGLVGGAIPGPVLTATFTEILQSGFMKSFRIILWAMVTETFVAFVSLVALSSAGLPETVFRALSFVGAAILLWISLSIWKVTTIDTEKRVHFSLGKISIMILANGVLWTFWITVCIPQALFLREALPYGQYVFLLLVEIGWLVSTVLIALLFSSFRRVLSHPRVVPVLFKVFALTFVFFAFRLAYTSGRYFASL